MESASKKSNRRWKVTIPIGYTPEGKKVFKCRFFKTNPACSESNRWNSSDKTIDDLLKKSAR